MSDSNKLGSSGRTSRRTIIKTLGTAGVIAGGTGLGTVSLTGSAAAASVSISASNPGTLANDRGDLTKVTVDPTFKVEWSNLDTAVGQVFYVIEGRIKDNDGNFTDWSPIFRSTPRLTPGNGGLSGVSQTKPGTTGSLEFTAPLSDIMKQSSEYRNATGEDPRSLPRSIEIVNELGRPNYESVSDTTYANSVTASSYLNGQPVGSADDAFKTLDNRRISTEADAAPQYGTSSLSNENDELPLVNNFPGAGSGYYGAAANTDAFDVGTDDTTDTNRIEVRYTFALKTLNEAAVKDFTQNSFSSDYNNNVDEAIKNDPQLANVRPSDVTSNAALVMDGNDGYPSITNNGAASASSDRYSAYQAIASSHPAVMTSTASFAVTVENEASTNGATGSSNTELQGGGQ